MVRKVDKQELKGRHRTQGGADLRAGQAGVQLGFIHHNVDCIGCRACEIACKDKNGLPPGPRFRRVMYVEGGSFPGRVRLQGQHGLQPLRRTGLPADLPDRRDLEAGRQRRGRYRLDVVHRLPPLRGGLPYGAPQWDPQEMVIRSATCASTNWRPAASLLRDGLHDARAGYRADRNLAGNAENHGHRARTTNR